MSKIKDLLAETEGIDDLMPERKPDYKYAAEKAVKNITAKSEDFRNYLWENISISEDCDDEGNKSFYFENFEELCDDKAESEIEAVVTDEQIDLSDEDFKRATLLAASILYDTYADMEDEVLNEFLEYAKEKWQKLLDYNNITLPRQ